MKSILIVAGVLSVLVLPSIASAQGIIGGAQQGASQGASTGKKAAGPVGGAVGGVVGGEFASAIGTQVKALAPFGRGTLLDAAIDAWVQANAATVERYLGMLGDIRAAHGNDFTTLSVAVRELANLIPSSSN